MANSDNTKLRILRLFQLLQTYTDDTHMISRKELMQKLEAEELGAVRQTIANDIAALELAGFHISTEIRGHNTCYRLETRAYTPAEMKILIDLTGASPFITEKDTADLSRKILSFASVYDKSLLERKYNVPAKVKTLNSETLKNLDIIHKAVQKNRRIEISCLDFDWRGNLEKDTCSKDVISPGYIIADYNDCYYLLAFSHRWNKVLNYRIDKIADLKVTGAARSGIDENMTKSLMRYRQYMFGFGKGNIISVTLECLKSKAALIYDKFGTELLPFPSQDPDWFHVTVQVAESEQFYGWLCGIGNYVKIQRPEEAREKFKVYLKKIIENNT